MFFAKNIPLRKRLKSYCADLFYVAGKSGYSPAKGFRVLLYHSVTDNIVQDEWMEATLPKDMFERQMRHLAENRYNIVDCRKAVEYLERREKMPPKTVVITFDDGYRDNYLSAWPILKKYGFCATIFVTLNFLRDYSGDGRFLSCSELRDMKKSGGIDIGCHGLTHRALTGLNIEELCRETIQVKQELEGVICDKVDLFAYPFGHSVSYNIYTIKQLKAAGFKGAVNTEFGINGPETDPFNIRRNRLSWFDGSGGLKKHLIGAYDWYRLCQRLRRKRYVSI